MPFSRRNETKLVVNERFFCQVLFFSSNFADSKRRGKKIKIGVTKKKRDLIIHPDERRTTMSSEEEETEEKKSECERFSRVNLYRCGVCSGRRR